MTELKYCEVCKLSHEPRPQCETIAKLMAQVESLNRAYNGLADRLGVGGLNTARHKDTW